jgi:hypothetical protein
MTSCAIHSGPEHLRACDGDEQVNGQKSGRVNASVVCVHASEGVVRVCHWQDGWGWKKVVVPPRPRPQT